MHCVQTLPADCRQIYAVDLQKNKKLALGINALALAVSLLMIVGMAFVVPISTLFAVQDGPSGMLLRLAVLCVGIVVYVILHEWVHGQSMKFFGARKVTFGFTGLYAYAGSKEDYFTKGAYLVIALAPLVVWGLVLLVVNLQVGREWFWVVYLIQIMNISGAMGDVFVAVKFAWMPRNILINDDGVSMRVYLPEG